MDSKERNFSKCENCDKLFDKSGLCPDCNHDGAESVMCVELGDYMLQDGEVVKVEKVNDYGYLPSIELEDGREYYVAESSELAGEAAKEYWRDMAENDPTEFRCMVGDESLVAWALGQWGGPGSVKTRSLEEWFDAVAECPEEEFAHYDGEEVEIGRYSEELEEELGFAPGVAYRHN